MTEATAINFDLKQSIEIDAPRERVFELVATPEGVAKWAPYTKFEPRVGGQYDFIKGEWHATGEITEIDPPRLVAYTWDWLNQPLGVRTEVRFELEERDGGTLLNLIHTGLPSEEQRQNHAHGWAHYEARVKDVAEGRDPGPDVMPER
jgi:uncharacterized protein YndB with AHSA1/START domain